MMAPARPQRGRSQGAPTHLTPAMVAALQRRLLAWFAANGRDLPWRHTRDPYLTLVSEVMLQQTQVSRVVPRFESWTRRFPTIESLASAPLADVLAEWAGLGYNNRAERLRRAALACVAASGGSGPAALPTTLTGLERLPGIGPYTARAVLVFSADADLAAVDANVRRVLTHELDLPPDLSATALQRLAERVLPRGRARDWHNALMDYGALVLTARTTGIPPQRRQTPFEGSRRWHRARCLRLLLSSGPVELSRLAALLELDEPDTSTLVTLLERDGLVRRSGTLVSIA
jgi:A/G-specific adenine glycosylase